MTPSPSFIRLTRDPSLVPPRRFERVAKAPGSYELTGGKLVEVRA